MFPVPSDSDKLRAAELINRTTILRRLFNSKARNETFDQFESDLQTRAPQLLILEDYYQHKSYEDLQYFADQTNDPFGYTDTQLHSMATQIYNFANLVLRNPFRTEYLQLLVNINQTVEESKGLENTPENVESTYGRLFVSLLNYAQASADRFAEFSNINSDKIAQAIRPYLFITNVDDDEYLTENSIFPIYAQLKILADNLASHLTLPQVAKFVYTRSLGSSGVSYISELEIPLFLTIIPIGFDYQRIREYWKLRFPNATEHFPPVSNAKQIDDAELQTLEGMIRQRIKYGYDTIRNAFINYSMPATDFEQDFQSPVDSVPPTPSASKKGQKDKKKQKRKDDPLQEHPQEDDEEMRYSDDENPPPKKEKGKKKQQQQDDDPDDDEYEPDSLLASLALDMTEQVQANPDDFASLDHMTRFKSKDENPRSISKYQMTDEDYFVTNRDRNGTQTYMVTYTRKSHKPIFNIVN